MKLYIHKINRFLIERYPNIWNTKLVWVIATSLIIHLIFFFLGYIGLMNPESLHSYRAQDVFFNSGAIFFSIILSVLIIVIWLVYLLKNNAFKAFYPTKNKDIFTQFCCYFSILFFSTSFFLSYSAGLKTYIHTTYPDAVMNSYISKANKAALFLSHKLSDYELKNKRYPAFFSDNYCEANKNLIDYTKSYYSTFEFDYQFYNIKKIDYKKNQLRSKDVAGYLFKTEKDKDTYTYAFKDSVLNAKPHIKTLQPSYLNYSETFYSNDETTELHYNSVSKTMIYNDKSGSDYYKNYTKERFFRSAENTKLLERNNPKEIKEVLSGFLNTAAIFKVETNLNVEKWFDLVYHPTHFELKNFIKNKRPPRYKYNSNKELTASQSYIKSHTTDFFIKSKDLKASFNNIDKIKKSTPISEGFQVFLWIAFSIALIILAFRVTNLKSVLFSVVTSGVIILLVSLIMMLFYYTFGRFSDIIGEEYIISYLALFIGTVILAIPWFYKHQLKKSIVGVFLNISIVGFLPYLFLILVIISMHQDDYYRDFYIKDYTQHQTLLELLGIYWSFIFIIIGFVFVYFYSATIKAWKALPEG